MVAGSGRPGPAIVWSQSSSTSYGAGLRFRAEPASLLRGIALSRRSPSPRPWGQAPPRSPCGRGHTLLGGGFLWFPV